MIDLVGDTTACGPDCDVFITKWTAWWAHQTRLGEVAMLDRAGGLDAYMELVGKKGRNMIRKANREYYYRKIVFNDWTHDIETVARSASVRQGIPMQGWYTEPVVPTRPAALCGLHRDEWYLGLRRSDHSPVAFVRIEVLNELGIINSILGDPAAGGSVNGLLAHLVEQAGVGWINYLHPEGRTQSLTDFKRRVGFRPMHVPMSSTPVAVPGGRL